MTTVKDLALARRAPVSGQTLLRRHLDTIPHPIATLASAETWVAPKHPAAPAPQNTYRLLPPRILRA